MVPMSLRRSHALLPLSYARALAARRPEKKATPSERSPLRTLFDSGHSQPDECPQSMRHDPSKHTHPV